MGKANFGSGAKIMKDFCNRFAILCANYKTTMFIISQERAQMCVSLATEVEYKELISNDNATYCN